MGTLWTEVQLLKEDSNLAPNVHAARSVIGRIIADKGKMSRREIVGATGLARSTIDGHLEVLMACGLVVDGGFGGSELRGRPAQIFKISPKRVVLIAEVRRENCRVAIATLNKDVIADSVVPISVEEGPETVLGVVAQRFEELLEAEGFKREDALAISVGLPGPVDVKQGYAVRPPHMPGWDGFGVCHAMAKRFHCDVVVDNDVNLMCLGEARSSRGAHVPLLAINVDWGVGGGFVTESGMLLHGAEGAAGDIGHVRVSDELDSLCACGRRGCLESVASIPAISRKVSEVRGVDVTPAEVIELLMKADAPTVDIVRRVAVYVGKAIADFVNLCNPARIVISGEITECTEDFLAQIRSVVYQQAQPLATRNLSIVHSTLGRDAGLLGGMISAIEQVLSPRGIQYHTQSRFSDLLPLGL